MVITVVLNLDVVSNTDFIRVNKMVIDPIVSCFIKIQNSSAFQVPAYPGCPGKKGR